MLGTVFGQRLDGKALGDFDAGRCAECVRRKDRVGIAEMWCCDEGFFGQGIEARDGCRACGDDCCIGLEHADRFDIWSAGVLFCANY